MDYTGIKSTICKIYVCTIYKRKNRSYIAADPPKFSHLLDVKRQDSSLIKTNMSRKRRRRWRQESGQERRRRRRHPQPEEMNNACQKKIEKTKRSGKRRQRRYKDNTTAAVGKWTPSTRSSVHIRSFTGVGSVGREIEGAKAPQYL